MSARKELNEYEILWGNSREGLEGGMGKQDSTGLLSEEPSVTISCYTTQSSSLSLIARCDISYIPSQTVFVFSTEEQSVSTSPVHEESVDVKISRLVGRRYLVLWVEDFPTRVYN